MAKYATKTSEMLRSTFGSVHVDLANSIIEDIKALTLDEAGETRKAFEAELESELDWAVEHGLNRQAKTKAKQLARFYFGDFDEKLAEHGKGKPRSLGGAAQLVTLFKGKTKAVDPTAAFERAIVNAMEKFGEATGANRSMIATYVTGIAAKYALVQEESKEKAAKAA